MTTSLPCRHYRSHEPMTVDVGSGAVLVVEGSEEAGTGPTDLLAPVFVDLQILSEWSVISGDDHDEDMRPPTSNGGRRRCRDTGSAL